MGKLEKRGDQPIKILKIEVQYLPNVVAESVCLLWVCLCVCLFVNTITAERVNIGWWNLGVGALYKNLGRVGICGYSPLGAHPQKCGVGLRRWENQRMLSCLYSNLSLSCGIRSHTHGCHSHNPDCRFFVLQHFANKCMQSNKTKWSVFIFLKPILR